MINIISVIVLTYNYGHYLKKCLSSLQSACLNNIRLEIILVDDGSTDSFTISYLETLKKHYHIIFSDNKGPSHARNLGLLQSTGEYVVFLDADDYIHKDYFIYGIDRIVKGGSDFFFPSYQCFGSYRSLVISPEFNIKKLLMKNYIIVTCLVKRQSLVNHNINFDVHMRDGLEDWEFRIHCVVSGLQGITGELPVVHIRKGLLSRTTGANKNKNQIFHYIFKKYLNFYKQELNIFQRIILLAEHNNTTFFVVFKKIILYLFPSGIREMIKGVK